MLELFRALERLNSARRVWPARGIPGPVAETMSEHMYQMAMILVAYPWDNPSDRTTALEMALVHGAPKAVAGDVISSDGITQESKRKREDLGLEFLACLAKESNNDAFADRIVGLWKEYEEGTTLISQVVRQADKLQTLSQAYLYSCRYSRLSHDLADFKRCRADITDSWLSERANAVLLEWQKADSRTISDSRVFIFVMGGPGVGKGTQCERAAREFGLKHISVGDLLRREQSSPGSIYKDFIGKSFREGVPVPPTLVMKLLNVELQALDAGGDERRGVILDGFPMTRNQLEAFEEEVSHQYSTILLDCPAEVMMQRLTHRASSSTREDDHLDRIRKRVEGFKTSNVEALLHLLSKNTVHKITCSGSIDEVQVAFQRCVKEQITLVAKE